MHDAPQQLTIIDLIGDTRPGAFPLPQLEELLGRVQAQDGGQQIELVAQRILEVCPRHLRAVSALQEAASRGHAKLPQCLETARQTRAAHGGATKVRMELLEDRSPSSHSSLPTISLRNVAHTLSRLVPRRRRSSTRRL